MAEGRSPRQAIDEVLAEHLVRILAEVGVPPPGGGTVEALVAVWDHLEPWPDAVPGLGRLREVATVGTLSNGTFGGLVRMARHCGLPWHCVIAAELFASYKPDPAVYLGAARLLGLAPESGCLVAAHPSDLVAARACGLRTAFVPRPLEWGPGASPEADPGADWAASDLEALATLFGA